MPASSEAVSHSPCCASRVTAGKPSRPTSSATIGAGRPHQPLWTVSPALSRRASEKAVAVVMRSSLAVIAPADGVASRSSAAGPDLRDRFRHQVDHRALNLVIGFLHVLGIEIPADFTEHVVVAGFLEIRQHDVLRISVGIGPGEPELLRRPQAEKFIATGGRLESQFLVVSELLLEAFLALVECGHGLLARRADAFSRIGLSARWPPTHSRGFNSRR